MKKIFALWLCIGTVTAVSAQSTREIENVKDVILGPKKGSGGSGTSNPKDVVLGDDRRVYDDNSRYPNASREAEIERINREYNQRIYDVRNNRNMSASERERRIRELEAERNRRIRQVNGRYENRTTRDRRYDDDDRYAKNKNKDKSYKSNNGNHYGWEKGVGNPHKGGNHPSKNKGNKGRKN